MASIHLKIIKVIVFDFDGVVVDSVKIKRQAYFDLFKQKGMDNIINKVLSRMGNNTRFDILRSIFSELDSNNSNLEQKIKKYSAKYNDLVQKSIKKNGLVKGARDVLTTLNRSYSLYINSNTPQQPLEESLKALGITNFFKGTFGVSENVGTYVNDKAKINNLSKIINLEKAAPANIVFIGDSEGDLNAAKAAGCLFIGVIGEANKWLDEDIPLIENLKELPDIIKTL